jgi:hypothetical protein
MSRLFVRSVPVVLVFALVTGLAADVKTRQKITGKFEGIFMGMLFNRMFGGNNGLTSTTAVQGDRMASTTDRMMQIIDLSEERIYQIDDLRRKEYKVTTFEEFRKMMEQARKDAEAQMKDMPPEDKAAMQEAMENVDLTVDVKETGATKAIAGHNTRQVLLTVTMHGKGQTVEQSGGLVLTNDMWMAPKIAAMDEIAAFFAKYVKAVFGTAFTGVDPQKAMSMFVFIPGLGMLMERMAVESQKLQGTVLSSTTLLESVKSAEQMKQASQPQSGGGGLGGLIGRGLMKRPAQPRSKVFTMTNETLSIDTTVSAADVAIPAGFKERK